MNQDIRAPYYGELGRLSFSPGWARPEPAMWPAPRPKFKPAVWRFAAAKAALDQAGEFVPVEQAERRNLIMVNPVEGNIYATSRNIVAAYQMVKAGEKARSHRHTAAALRLVVEAKPGTYTVVDGARVEIAARHFKLRENDAPLGRVTISAGVVASTPGESDEALLLRADALLYRAKDRGRNRVEIERVD